MAFPFPKSQCVWMQTVILRLPPISIQSQAHEEQLSDWRATENHLDWLKGSTLTEPLQINKSQGKSHNPAELGQAWAAWRYVGVSLWRSRGVRLVFFSRTLLVQACLKKQRTVRVLLSVKWVGCMYQGALWESQWEWSWRGNDSCYLFEREQKQTTESRNMIENTDMAELYRENCFLIALITFSVENKISLFKSNQHF